jgi:hypothetical protein
MFYKIGFITLFLDWSDLKITEDLVNSGGLSHLMKIEWVIKRLIILIRPWLGVTFLINSDLSQPPRAYKKGSPP